MTDDRFRPTRAGIVNLWDYADEEFAFADGRLVLRGPNGSGKTKALEVLFPFVLDGRIEPRRLNPFASEDRTMKSNLLYRGQDSSHAYVWLEFLRDGEAVTVGAGLRAQRHNDRVTRWYFVVDGRVGVDFSLLGPDDRPLTKKQLVAELGPDAVTDRAPAHRAAVDERLFGLGAERYEQMLTLVLTLRRPQLAKNLEPKGLSRTLTDGLRPLDDALITEAARSFDDMESVQRTLTGLVQADEAAQLFLSTYTTYLRTHVRAASDALGDRLTAVDRSCTTLAERLRVEREAAERRTAAESAAQLLRRELARSRERLDSLMGTAAYESKADLDRLDRMVRELARAADLQRDQAGRAAGRADRLRAAAEEHQGALDDADRAVSRAADELASAAADAGISWDAADAAADAEFDARVTARIAMRADDVAAVRRALDDLATARRERDGRQLRLDAAEQAVRDADAERARADEALTAAGVSVATELAEWSSRHHATLTDLGTPRAGELLAAALQRVGEPEMPGLGYVFHQAVRDAVDRRREHAVALRNERDTVRADRDRLAEQRAEIAAERDDAPPSFAAWTADRAERSGGPLWQLVRFAGGVTAEQAAGVEAALAAANLLDAWISPDGVALRTEESDGYLVPLPAERRPSGRTLTEVLEPEPDGPVPAARILDVLGSVALVDDELERADPAVPLVSGAGRYAQGIQLGAHHKAEPEYIGATARRKRRLLRLAELDRAISLNETELRRLDGEIATVEALLETVQVAERELPGTGPIVVAQATLAEVTARLRVLRDAAGAALAELDQALAAVGESERSLVRIGSERSIEPDRQVVDRVAGAIERFGRSGTDLAGRRGAADAARSRLADARQQFAEAISDAERQAAEAADAELSHAAQAEAFETLQAAVGADVEQLRADLESARTAIGAAEQRQREAQQELLDATGAAATGQEAVNGARSVLTSAIAEAQADARRLAPYAHRELLDLLRVSPEVAWPATDEDWRTAAELADRVARSDDAAATVAAVPAAVAELHAAIDKVTGELRPTEASLKSSKTRVSGALADLQSQLSAAGHEYRPEWESDDDVIVVRVADEQGYAPIGRFAERISAARRDQELLLTESERRILEDALLGRLSHQIHDRTIDARDLIGRMATEMRSRRMSSGTGVGVRWELADDLDAEQRAVCKLLEQDASRLGPDELARLRAHFADRIKTARAQHPDRTYAELLADALDYRQWRTFVFYLLTAAGGEERLTQARHSTLSGGEQSVSLHLPLFAAARVMLSSASVACPRLLALDEAFAGVDDTGRRELLGLATQFDLDLFMTGYDLWATYDTVPACAHYDLSHSAAERTVSALLLVWDGKEMLADTGGDLAAALGSPGTRQRAVAADNGLLEDGDE